MKNWRALSSAVLSLTARTLAWLAAAMLLITPGAASALAQNTGWSEPSIVFEVAEGRLRLPVVVADEYGQVHGFWLHQPGSALDPALVYYARLDEPNVPPVDILAAEAQGLTAVSSAEGLVLLWNGAVYSLAGPSPAVSAKAWTAPDSLATSYFNGGLAVAPDGAPWVIYGSRETASVVVQRYDPVIHAWENPQLVANASNVSAVPDALHLAVGADGTLHAVWAEFQFPQGWPPLGLYYARSEDGGNTWSLPRQFAPANYNQPNVITGPDNTVYIAWVGAAGIGGKYVQQSTDGGKTWDATVDVFPANPIGGSEGAPNLKIDSAGVLHTVFSNAGCVWHVSLDQGSWSSPECLSQGQNEEIEEPAMDIGLGNQIHVLYWTRNGQLWYTTRTLPAPALDPLPIPTEPPPPPTVAVPTATLVPTATPLPDFGTLPEFSQTSQASLWALGAGVAPVMLLVLVVLVGRARRR